MSAPACSRQLIKDDNHERSLADYMQLLLRVEQIQPFTLHALMATRTNLDLDTLRTLVVAHDLGGLAPAADRLGRTPSAISLQMKRLQGDLEQCCFANAAAVCYSPKLEKLHSSMRGAFLPCMTSCWTPSSEVAYSPFQTRVEA